MGDWKMLGPGCLAPARSSHHHGREGVKSEGWSYSRLGLNTSKLLVCSLAALISLGTKAVAYILPRVCNHVHLYFIYIRTQVTAGQYQIQGYRFALCCPLRQATSVTGTTVLRGGVGREQDGAVSVR